MMEHAKPSIRSICLCPTCVDAYNLQERATGEKPMS